MGFKERFFKRVKDLLREWGLDKPFVLDNRAKIIIIHVMVASIIIFGFNKLDNRLRYYALGLILYFLGVWKQRLSSSNWYPGHGGYISMQELNETLKKSKNKGESNVDK
jgi:hypothetical protein